MINEPTDRWMAYRFGFKHGAGTRPKHDRLVAEPDYQRGYNDGLLAYQEAAERFRVEVGAPPASILREEAGL